MAAGLVLAVAWLTFAQAAASAHGGPAIVELGSERVNPGGVLEVRGDLGSGERIEVAIAS